jgi:hypothetical protein
MKKTNGSKLKDNHQENIIGKTFRAGGFLFPETVDEVKVFEQIYGATDVILPQELQEPSFLYSNQKKKLNAYFIADCSENLALAAREGSHKLPADIQKRMEDDRIKEDAKRKRNNKNK